jgi:phage I-like protein
MNHPVNSPLFGFSSLLPATAAEGGASLVWIKVMPAGRFQGRDGRGPFDAGDKTAMQAIIDRSVAHYAGCDLMLDYDHQSLFSAGPGKGGTAPASGWFKQFEARDDGIYGQVEWTAAAAEKIKSQEYRYISPLFTTQKTTGKVWRIDNAALVNQPNLPLDAIAAAAQRFESKEVPPMNEFLAKVAKALGLEDGASEEAVISAASTLHAERSQVAMAAGLKADAKVGEVLTAMAALKTADAGLDPTDFVPMSMFTELQTKLDATVTGTANEKAEDAVKVAMSAGKITPANKDWALAYAKRDLGEFEAFVGRQPKLTSQQLTRPVIEDGKPALSDEDRVAMGALGLTEEQFVASRKLEQH